MKKLEKKIVEKYPRLGSSVNENEVSLRVKAALLAAVPILVVIGPIFGLNWIESDLVKVIDAIGLIISVILYVKGHLRVPKL